MDGRAKHVVVGFILAGFCHVCTAVSCTSETEFTCAPTLLVIGTCNKRTDVCDCVAGYTPVTTGCAGSGGEEQAVITAGDHDELSGWVYVDNTGTANITLKCNAPASSGSDVFRWYLADQEVSGSTGDTLNVTVTASSQLSYRCSVPRGVVTYARSEAFVIRGYGEGATIGERPVVTGMSKRHFDQGVANLRCSNLPQDPDLTYRWGNQDSNNSTNDLQYPADQDVATTSCSIVIGSRTQQFESEQSADVTSIRVDPDNLDLSVEIAEGSTLTVAKGQTYNLKCQISETVSLPSGQTAVTYFDYTWNRDGQVITTCSLCSNGQPDIHVFSTDNMAVSDTVQFTCAIHVKGHTSTVESSPVTVTVVDSKLDKVQTVILSRVAPLGGYNEMRCLITGDTSEGITYSWMYGSATIPGQTDSTIQLNDLSNAERGDYSCSATKGDVTITSSSAKMNPVSLLRPSWSHTMFGATYIKGKTYTINCFSISHTPGMTYEWFIGDEKQATGNVYQFVATSDFGPTCKTTFGDKTYSSQFPVQVQTFTQPTISGPSKPVLGTNAVYTCNAEISPDVQPIYKWSANGDALTEETSSLTLTNINAADHSKTYTCEVTGGSEVKTSNGVFLSPSALPAKPTVVSTVDTLHKQGTYTLTCSSDSFVDTAQFQWNFEAAATGSAKESLPTTGNVHTISLASSANAGKYWCQITVDSKTSPESDAKTIGYLDKMGKVCADSSDCMPLMKLWFLLYSGSCIDGVCQCYRGVHVSPDECGGEAPTPDPNTTDTANSSTQDNVGSRTLHYSLATLWLAFMSFFTFMLLFN